jgi:hypothetical protein
MHVTLLAVVQWFKARVLETGRKQGIQIFGYVSVEEPVALSM